MTGQKSVSQKRYGPGPVRWCMCAAAYILASVFLSWLFYDSFIPVLISAPGYILFAKAVKKAYGRRIDEEMTDGFIRALVSVSTSLAAGVSAENAFAAAGSDMERLFGKRAVIVTELETVNSGVAAGRSLGDALNDLAGRWDIGEIKDFAVVFSVAKEKGADLSLVLSSCIRIMENRRQTESEARVLIRGKQYEQRLMCIIPPAILAYLRLSSGSFIGILYHDAKGIAVMTACLAVYILAIRISEKIGDIRV